MGAGDGPFPLSRVNSVPRGRFGQAGAYSAAHASHAAGGSLGRHAAGTVSPVASHSGLVFWDEQSAQQLYVRYPGPEASTDRGSYSDMGTARGFPVTPNSQHHNVGMNAVDCLHGQDTRITGDVGALLFF